MNILVACEFSATVRDEFRKRGHNAYSCDILPTEGDGRYHIQDDIKRFLYKPWDIIIAFPPCTDLAVSGARWFEEKRKDGRQQKSIDFFLQFTKLDCSKVAIENPIGVMSSIYRKPDQIIQPWQFGHGETKATCLWLKGLPLLNPTNIVDGREPKVHYCSPGVDRWKIRSRTYQGIAQAMAEQWG